MGADNPIPIPIPSLHSRAVVGGQGPSLGIRGPTDANHDCRRAAPSTRCRSAVYRRYLRLTHRSLSAAAARSIAGGKRVRKGAVPLLPRCHGIGRQSSRYRCSCLPGGQVARIMAATAGDCEGLHGVNACFE
jgi:hypothetical protein